MVSDFIYTLYKDQRSVYSLKEIALLLNEQDFHKLKQRVNYYVKTNKLINLRRGIYAKENFSKEELACKIYKPAYISLDYVLQKEGIIFQYNPQITVISYLSRYIIINDISINYRKIKNTLLYNDHGIIMTDTGISIASPERAFLDALYLNKDKYFDALAHLKREIILELLPIYKSTSLSKRVNKLISYA